MADFSEDKIEVKPSIIMKVDAPPEDNNALTSQGTSMNIPDQSDATKTQIKPVLESPRLNNKVLNIPKLNATAATGTVGGVVLRPSQLGSKVDNKTKNTKNPFALNPSRLSSFDKTLDASSSSSKNGTGHDAATSSTSNTFENNLAPKTMDARCTDTNNAVSSTPKFVPLVVTTETPKSSTSNVSSSTSTSSSASTSNFVFGQNLHERVVSESENDVSTTHDVNSIATAAAAAASASSSSASSTSSCSNANGTSELLFSSAAKKAATQETNKEVKSLTESAREYEESRANKRKYEEVQVVTGEEDEKNILQINCKLFAFDKVTSNWQERGRGTLRLNDKEVSGENLDKYNQSRLVFRTAGSLRVVLNTKIWAEMTIDKAGLKSLRLTAMDASGQIKVFLIMASTEEINQLQRLLESRVKSEIERQKLLKKYNVEPEVKKQAIENNGQ